MASATFVLKEPSVKTETLIYLLFRFNNQKLKYSTGLKINPKFWNWEKQRAKETRQFSDYLEFNACLNKIENAIFHIHRRLFNDGVIPEIEILRHELNKALLKTVVNKKNDLISFAEDLSENSLRKS